MKLLEERIRKDGTVKAGNVLKVDSFPVSYTHLNSPAGVAIILFSDNVGNNKLHNIEFTDFCKEYPCLLYTSRCV